MPDETGLLACLCISIVDKDCKGILDSKKAGAFGARMRITKQKTNCHVPAFLPFFSCLKNSPHSAPHSYAAEASGASEDIGIYLCFNREFPICCC